MVSRTIPNPKAKLKLPLLVSKAIAVVMTLVTWSILPPTIITAPTSAIALPKPASKTVANELIHNIAPNYLDRNGGYTRVIKLGNRKNDDAVKALIEFVDFKDLSVDDNQPETDKKETKKEQTK